MEIITKTNFTNWETLINNYIELLIKSESLHEKLEKLCEEALNNTSKQLQNEILKVNNILNKTLVETMEYITAINCYEENIVA